MHVNAIHKVKHVHACMHMHTQAHAYTFTHAHAHANAQCTREHTHTYTFMHAYMCIFNRHAHTIMHECTCCTYVCVCVYSYCASVLRVSMRDTTPQASTVYHTSYVPSLFAPKSDSRQPRIRTRIVRMAAVPREFGNSKLEW
jgi:hypothetical protein